MGGIRSGTRDVGVIDPRAENEAEPPAWFRRIAAGADVIPLLPAGTPSPAARTTQPPASGILVVDKPAGLTSFQVVQAVRRASGERRVGHAGTLDPMATGVLVVCLGSATRVIDEIQDSAKGYRAEVTFGVSTDTYDAEGKTVGESDASHLTADQLEAALAQFRGEIDQVPPMFSALHHEGERLYELARRGEEVDRASRRLTIHRLDLIAFDSPRATIEMEVSKGTYVRSLAHDLGIALGVGAHLSALRRTAVGRFTEAGAHKLDTITAAFSEGWWPSLLFTLDHALLHLPAVIVAAEGEADMRHGRGFTGPEPLTGLDLPARVYNRDGGFVGLAAWDPIALRWLPERVFPAPK